MSQYAKAYVAIVGAVSTWAATYYPDDLDVQKWLGLAVALATVAGVYGVKNTPDRSSERGASDVVVLVAAVLICLAVLLAADKF